MLVFSSIFRAFCAVFARIFPQDKLSKVTETSPDVEKVITIAEIQQRGTGHNHLFILDSAPTQMPYDTYNVFNNLQRYSSAGSVMSKYVDELSDDTHSSMPSLELMDSLPSMECSVKNVNVPVEMTAMDMARISAVDEVN